LSWALGLLTLAQCSMICSASGVIQTSLVTLANGDSKGGIREKKE
jgi:hypothetical protein